MTGTVARPVLGDRPADPSSPPDYRRVLGRIPTGVAIVAGIYGARPVGVAVGSFTSVSLDPPLVGFFIATTSTTWPVIELSGGFCASILGADQDGVSRQFGTSGAERFAGCGWRSSPGGRPIIDGAVAWLDCSIEEILPAGDHRLVLGRIESMASSHDGEPLVFLGGRHRRLTEERRDA
ncbi:flavin reductase family protein [Acidiferrimicrobium sp. IK]|nr:flavin reductase family protein [Acidiferrimicrobium sp. IK]